MMQSTKEDIEEIGRNLDNVRTYVGNSNDGQLKAKYDFVIKRFKVLQESFSKASQSLSSSPTANKSSSEVIPPGGVSFYLKKSYHQAHKPVSSVKNINLKHAPQQLRDVFRRRQYLEELTTDCNNNNGQQPRFHIDQKTLGLLEHKINRNIARLHTYLSSSNLSLDFGASSSNKHPAPPPTPPDSLSKNVSVQAQQQSLTLISSSPQIATPTSAPNTSKSINMAPPNYKACFRFHEASTSYSPVSSHRGTQCSIKRTRPISLLIQVDEVPAEIQLNIVPSSSATKPPTIRWSVEGEKYSQCLQVDDGAFNSSVPTNMLSCNLKQNESRSTLLSYMKPEAMLKKVSNQPSPKVEANKTRDLENKIYSNLFFATPTKASSAAKENQEPKSIASTLEEIAVESFHASPDTTTKEEKALPQETPPLNDLDKLTASQLSDISLGDLEMSIVDQDGTKNDQVQLDEATTGVVVTPDRGDVNVIDQAGQTPKTYISHGGVFIEEGTNTPSASEVSTPKSRSSMLQTPSSSKTVPFPLPPLLSKATIPSQSTSSSCSSLELPSTTPKHKRGNSIMKLMNTPIDEDPSESSPFSPKKRKANDFKNIPFAILCAGKEVRQQYKRQVQKANKFAAGGDSSSDDDGEVFNVRRNGLL